MIDPFQLFRSAADFLEDGPWGFDDAQRARLTQILDSVGLGADGEHAEWEPRRLDAARLLRATAELDGFFRLRSRQAPGFAFFGGLITPRGIDGLPLPDMSSSISGAGLSPGDAFRSCIGEGVEYVAQFNRPTIGLRYGTMDEAIAWNGGPHTAAMMHWIETDRAIDWILAERIVDGRQLWIPACLTLRPTEGDRWAVGSGCAAGPTASAALTGAMFEVIERDAVAMWWRGGRPLARITHDQCAALGIDELLHRIGGNQRDRVTLLNQIPCDFGLACVASISFDRDGGNFAGGYACDDDPFRACQSAIREMCQMELGNEIVASRMAGSKQSASEMDRSIHNRVNTVRQDAQQFRCERVADLSQPGARTAEDVAFGLAAAGYEAYRVDLTMDQFGIPVAKIIVPGLQPYPSSYQTRRLSNSILERLDSDHASELDLF